MVVPLKSVVVMVSEPEQRTQSREDLKQTQWLQKRSANYMDNATPAFHHLPKQPRTAAHLEKNDI